MVDFEFYVNQYVGNRVPQRQFPAMAARAAEYLARFERICRVEQAGEVSRKMAICAMAETLYEESCRQGALSQSVGDVTVRYETGAGLQSRLFQKAGIYLDLRRGVG